MIYDFTQGQDGMRDGAGHPGFTIHEDLDAPTHKYSLYTDDGRGNGDFIASTDDIYWIRRIASALDADDRHYTANGFPK